MKLSFRRKNWTDDRLDPAGRYTVMLYPTGVLWVPEPTPSWTSGRFGRPTRRDWRRQARLAANQVHALACELRDAHTAHPELRTEGNAAWRPLDMSQHLDMRSHL
jgi:hypothetical protein